MKQKSEPPRWVSCRLYKERLSQVEVKLQEVMAGCAQEYLEPLANLQENMQIRTKVAGERLLPPSWLPGQRNKLSFGTL